MFGSNLQSGTVFNTAANAGASNPMKDFEVTAAAEDTVQALEFSPPSLPQNFLIAGGWDNSVS